MTSFVSHTSVDCANAYALARWWKELLGYVEDPDDPNAPGDEECATQVADLRGKYGPGTGWVVLADPEGNEFCILRSEQEIDRA
ncbi:hypothetical protein IEQ44_08645 [Nocardioides sp. Y6]|uniref:Glyoxalase-like domain-containing protein n=1 Tax=Nocardioides malaquae TaxID=2773426 RepID=A0ABR9RUA7_9ACTN|nr:VOC family protein [Nocardioides malaquae]MBE7324720.1 hypothetical protein [Nocardioides malaquae]